jgi:hypothetical protein
MISEGLDKEILCFAREGTNAANLELIIYKIIIINV